MNIFKYTFYIITLLVVAFAGCDSKKSGKLTIETPRTEPTFKKEGVLSFLSTSNDTIKTIDIEIADNQAETTQGMMFRTSMDYDKGMLFIMDREREQSFWMKNTKMPLDIIYVNSDLEIVTIYKHTQPYSESPIRSFKPALYVVETSAGFCNEVGLKEGDKIIFQRIPLPA